MPESLFNKIVDCRPSASLKTELDIRIICKNNFFIENLRTSASGYKILNTKLNGILIIGNMGFNKTDLIRR